jgi:protein-S-isoprenylcysteine O-methyltransferase Ste14
MNILNLKAIGSLLLLFLAVAGLLFIAASTLDYWQAWTFLAVYVAGCLSVTVYLMKKDPKLLQRRMRGGPAAEKRPAQKIAMLLTSIVFVALLVVPAIDHRLGWSRMPPSVALAGDLLVALGFLAVFFVFRVNSFASATIELADGQHVVSTGPYALVRHPMYAGGLVLLFGMPLALGSWWGLIVVAVMIPALMWRLLDEERFLARMLPGYFDYMQNVRYRLIPGAW